MPPTHLLVIAGGPHRHAGTGLEKDDEPGTGRRHQKHREQEGGDIPAAEHLINGIAGHRGAPFRGALQVQVGLAAQHRIVHGVQPGHGEDAGQDGVEPQAGLQKAGDQPRQGPGQDAGQNAPDGVARHRDGGTGGHAEDKAAVHRQVRGVQHPEGDEHPQRHGGIDKALAQRRDQQVKKIHPVHAPLVLIIRRSGWCRPFPPGRCSLPAFRRSAPGPGHPQPAGSHTWRTR